MGVALLALPTATMAAAPRVQSSGTGVPNERVYVTNSASNDVIALGIGADGGLTSIAPAVPSGGDSPQGIALDPTGRFGYVANLLSANVAAFALAGQQPLSAI